MKIAGTVAEGLHLPVNLLKPLTRNPFLDFQIGIAETEFFGPFSRSLRAIESSLR